MSRQRRRGWKVLIALAITVALTPVSVACSSQPKETVLVVGSPCKVCLRLMLTASGQDQGAPYRIEWADFDSAPPMVEAMNAGRVDVAWAGEVGIFFGISHGAKVQLLAGNHGPPPSASRILVKKGSDLRSVADLKGKKVAMPFYTVPQYPLVKALEKEGLTWNDVQMVNLSTTDGLVAFNSGEVDAFVIWDANAAVVETDHNGRTLHKLGEVINPDQAFVASGPALNDPAKKAALEDLTRRVVRSLAWINGHEEEWAQHVSQQTGISIEAARLAASRDKWQLVPIDDSVVRRWQEEVDYFHQIGQIGRNFAVRDHVAPGFDVVVSDELTGLDAPK